MIILLLYVVAAAACFTVAADSVDDSNRETLVLAECIYWGLFGPVVLILMAVGLCLITTASLFVLLVEGIHKWVEQISR